MGCDFWSSCNQTPALPDSCVCLCPLEAHSPHISTLICKAGRAIITTVCYFCDYVKSRTLSRCTPSLEHQKHSRDRGWRNGSMVKSICWSYREPGFYSLHSYGSSRSLLILTPGDPLPSSGFLGTRDTCGTHTYMQASTHSRIKQKQEQSEVLTIHDHDNDGDKDNGGDDGLW